MGCGGSTATKVSTVHIEQERKKSAPTSRPQQSAQKDSVKEEHKQKKKSSRRSSSASSSSSHSSKGSKKVVVRREEDKKQEEEYQHIQQEDQHIQQEDQHETGHDDLAVIPEPVQTPSTDVLKVNAEEPPDDDNDEGVFDEDQVEGEADVDLVPLNIPDNVNGTAENKEITLDDIVQHNTDIGWNEWFLYGKKVYSCTTLLSVVKDRMADDILKNSEEGEDLTPEKVLKNTYPIYGMTTYGVRSKEVKKILHPCLVGKLSNIPRDEYLRRMKADVEKVIAELEAEEEQTEIIQDHLAQYSRWLEAYPNVQLENKTPSSVSGNPNDADFQLPEGISTDPLLLRNWTDSWEMFDTEVPEGGAWGMQDKDVIEPLGDTSAVFAQVVSENRDEEPAFDMAIDGEAGWTVIEQDILKNDVTTPEQDDIWKSRETRKYLDDPVRMQKRREKIGQYFMAQYEQETLWLEQYMNFTATLEEGWQEFLQLCETFDPSNVPPPKEYNLPPPSDFKHSDQSVAKVKTQEETLGDEDEIVVKTSDTKPEEDGRGGGERRGGGGSNNDDYGDDMFDDQSNADTATSDHAPADTATSDQATADGGAKDNVVPVQAVKRSVSNGSINSESDIMEKPQETQVTNGTDREGSASSKRSLSSLGSVRKDKPRIENNEERRGSNASKVSDASVR